MQIVTIYTDIYTHTYMYMCVNICIYTRVCMCAYTPVCVCMYVYFKLICIIYFLAPHVFLLQKEKFEFW